MTTDDAEGTELWVPNSYVEEGGPPPRATPDAWIMHLPGEANHFLAPADDFMLADDERVTGRLLHQGEKVAFLSMRDFGEATLTLDPDGTWTVSRPMPVEADTVWIVGDSASVDDSAESIVRYLVEDASDSGTYQIGYAAWSGPTPFIFRDGAFHREG